VSDQIQTEVVSRLKFLSRVASVAVMSTGGLVLIGWLLDIAALKSVWPGLVTMKANAALAFVFGGCALWMVGSDPADPFSGRRRRVGQVFACIVALMGLLTLGEYFFGWDLGIDQWLFQDAHGMADTAHGGRMPHITALNFVVIGLALLLLHRRFGLLAAQSLSLLATLVSLLALVGYAYGIQSFYMGVVFYTQMGLPTAGTFLVLSSGLLLARADQGLMATITSQSTGGVMARRLLPAALVIPALLGGLRLAGEMTGIYDAQFGVSLMVMGSIVVFTALIWWNADSLNRMDARHWQAEEKVRASEEKLRALADTAKDAIISADSRGNIIYFNPGAEHIFGYPATRVIGQPLTLLMPERFHPAFWRGLERFLAKGEAHVIGTTVEFAGKTLEGREFPLELSLATWKTGEGSFFTAIIRDITRRKRAEEKIKTLNDDLKRRSAELEAANKELKTFAYSVSHDLRSPLRAIDGFSNALVNNCWEKLDPRSKNDLQRVRAASQRMGQLIDDMLALSRVTRSEMRCTAVDLSALAESILTELQKNQPERKVEFFIAPKLVVNADSNLLRIALENLLGNAWKFTAKRPKAQIELGLTSHDGKQAYFVRDDGAGFDMAYAGKLFGAFQRLHRVAEFEGTGIGLATVQRIIHRHGGVVWAEGAVEKGATFYFTLT
jgi:PAS domain S-box-containing protein